MKVLLLLSLIITIGITPALGDSMGYKTITSSSLQFQVNVPEGWTEENSDINLWRQLSSKDRTIENFPSVQISSPNGQVLMIVTENVKHNLEPLSAGARGAMNNFCHNNLIGEIYCDAFSTREKNCSETIDGCYRETNFPYKAEFDPNGQIKILKVVYWYGLGHHENQRNVLFVYDEKLEDFSHLAIMENFQIIGKLDKQKSYSYDTKTPPKTCQKLFAEKNDYCGNTWNWKCIERKDGVCIRMMEAPPPDQKPKSVEKLKTGSDYEGTKTYAERAVEKEIQKSILNSMEKYKWNNENYEGESLKPLPPQYKFQQLPSEDMGKKDPMKLAEEKLKVLKQSEQPSINKFPDMTPPEKQFVDQKPKPKLSFWESIFCWFGRC